MRYWRLNLSLVIVSLSIAIGSASAGPVVFSVSDPVGPNETALLFGDGIGPAVKATGWRVTDSAAVEGPPTGAAPRGEAA